MSNLVTRLNGHFAALAAVGAVAAIGGVAQNAQAAVVYSGVLNTNIPNTFDGLYLNLVTGAATTPSSNPGFDINPYAAGGVWNMFEGAGCTEIGVGTTFTALSAGTPIDGTGAYINGSTFPAAFGTTAILGVRFVRESDSATLFGWVRLTLPGSPAATGAGTLVDYAYEDTGAGINAGATIPAPTAGMAVLALGGLGLLGRRRKS